MQKTNKTTKLSTEVVATTEKTPIEVMLGIDEDGMTTASKLYEFLELDPKNFSHWYGRNIIKNKFAEENVDYIPFVVENERYNPKPKTDYRITADFAKKPSMTGNTERHEEARSYFIACEQGLKVAIHKLQSQPQLDLSPLVDAIAAITKSVASLQDDVKELKENQKNRYLMGQKYPSAWYKRISPKFKMLQNYFGITRSELYHNIYKELEDTYDIDIDQIHEEYAYENHLYNVSFCFLHCMDLYSDNVNSGCKHGVKIKNRQKYDEFYQIEGLIDSIQRV